MVNVITFASGVCLHTVNLSTGTGQFIVQKYSDSVQVDQLTPQSEGYNHAHA